MKLIHHLITSLLYSVVFAWPFLNVMVSNTIILSLKTCCVRLRFSWITTWFLNTAFWSCFWHGWLCFQFWQFLFIENFIKQGFTWDAECILTSKRMWQNLILWSGGHSTKRPFFSLNFADKLTMEVRLVRTVGKSLWNGISKGLLPVHASLRSENFGQYWLAPLQFPQDVIQKSSLLIVRGHYVGTYHMLTFSISLSPSMVYKWLLVVRWTFPSTAPMCIPG